MSARARWFTLGTFIGAVVITALILPAANTTGMLNLANAQIARAASLPSDAPARLVALADAETQLTQARAQSTSPRIAVASARLWLEQRNPQRAIGALKATDSQLNDDFIAQFIWGNAESLGVHPAAASNHWRMAGAYEYFINQAHRAADKHLWVQAEVNARYAIAIAPERADAHYALGDALVAQSASSAEAVLELVRAQELTRDPELLATIITRQAEALVRQGKDREALEYFDRARQIAPIDARPRVGYALALVRLDPAAKREASTILAQVADDAPWTVSGHLALAQLAQADGDFKRAEEWYQRGLARDPNNPALLMEWGQMNARLNRIDDAKKLLTLALKYEPHWDDLLAIQQALERLGRHE